MSNYLSRLHACERSIQRGFTLAELSIVIIVIGVVMAIIVPRFTAGGEEKVKAADSGITLDKLLHDGTHTVQAQLIESGIIKGKTSFVLRYAGCEFTEPVGLQWWGQRDQGRFYPLSVGVKNGRIYSRSGSACTYPPKYALVKGEEGERLSLAEAALREGIPVDEKIINKNISPGKANSYQSDPKNNTPGCGWGTNDSGEMMHQPC